jgi:lipid-binding SYLF domain-containing protein
MLEARGSAGLPKKRQKYKGEVMRKILAMCLTAVFVATMVVPVFAGDADEINRLKESGEVLREVLNVPEDIPQDLLDRAECVIVIPSVKKAAFVVGASYGRGAMSCRTGPDWAGRWSAPTMMALEGGSFGLQIGVQSTDFVILVMNGRGANSLLSSKVKLGADASIAAGPKGRNASADTDIYMRAEMLSYSRAQGIFIGVSLAGSTLRPDNGANKVIYGHDVNPKDVVHSSTMKVPSAARLMVATLNRRSPKNRSDVKARS